MSGLPGRNLSPTTKSLRAMGKMNARYCAMAPIEKTAPIATGLANMRRPRSAPMKSTNQTALTGVWVCLFTRFSQRDNGSAPSREYAKVTRDAATRILRRYRCQCTR